MAQPFLVMIAGPNGSGKTTLIEEMRRRGIDLGEHINPDEIAQGLEGTYTNRVMRAQRIADIRRDECIEARRSFSFETVMSHPSKIEVLRKAKEANFFVQLIYIGTDDPRTNVERVALRVAQGGHAVPEDRIVNRWRRSMSLLASAIEASDRSDIFDNSAAGMINLVSNHEAPGKIHTVPQLVLHFEGRRWQPAYRTKTFPDWVREYAISPFEHQ